MTIPKKDIKLGEGYVFETDEIDSRDHGESDSEELDFEDEARRMMISWDRANLMREIGEEKEAYNMTDDDYTNYYDGTKSFDELKQGMDPVGSDMVHVKVLEKNPSGKEIFASSTVLFDRIGFFEFNPIPFESSIHDGKPSSVNLAVGPLIAGLVQGLTCLRQGERANILIHPAMAFRELGSPPIIPKNAHLFYNVKIHKVWDESDFDGVLAFERSEHLFVPLMKKIELVEQHKTVANQYLTDGQTREALVRYKAALAWLNEAPEDERARSPECSRLSSILYQNIAIALNMLGSHKSASKAAKQALSIDPRNVKAMYQLAKARAALGNYERAIQALDEASKIAPDNSSLRYLKTQIDTHLTDEKKRRVEIMKKMSKAVV